MILVCVSTAFDKHSRFQKSVKKNINMTRILYVVTEELSLVLVGTGERSIITLKILHG